MYGETVSFRPVEDWLRSLGLICFAQAFYDNGYEDIEICKQIAEGDLDAIGVKNVKDRTDILAGVIRLKQKAVYFELEPEEESNEVVKRKLEPFLLMTRIKAELENDNIQLTQPPFFFPDGSFGDLTSLAERLSYNLETFEEDVLKSLDQLRRRQLPADSYKDVSEMMQLQKDQEKKHHIPVPKDEIEEPDAYLNVEVPYRRTTSMSKHDKRITKSTTNLFEATDDVKTFIKKKPPENKKRKPVAKSHSVMHSKNSRNPLSSMLRRTPSDGPAGKADLKNKAVLAKDITMGQNQLVELMTQVKLGKRSQDNVLDEVNQHSRMSMAVDFTPPSSPDMVKGNSSSLSKKEKKKLEKEEKKKKKKSKRVKQPGKSFFYTAGVDTGSKNSDIGNADTGNQALLTSFGNIENNLTDGNESKTSPHPGAVNTGFHRNSSGGSMSSGAGSLISIDSQDNDERGKLNIAKTVAKPLTVPPPIPSRGDSLNVEKSPNTTPESHNHAVKVNRANSSASNSPCNQLNNNNNNNETPPMMRLRKTSDPMRNNSIPNRTIGNSIPKSDDNSFRIKSIPFNSDEIKQKSTEIKARLVESQTRKMSGATPVLESSQSNAASNSGAGSQDSCQSTPPVPPPRTTTLKSGDEASSVKSNRPLVPPRKRRSDSCSSKSQEEIESSPKLPLSHSVSVGNVLSKPSPLTKPKPSIPPRDFSSASKPSRPSLQATTVEKPTSSMTFSVSAVDRNGIKEEASPTSVNVDSSNKKNGRLSFENKQSVEKIVLKRKPLKDLVRRKLTLEMVDLTVHPYSLSDGSWNIPSSLISRYASELKREPKDVAKAMDELRVDLLRQHDKPSKLCNLDLPLRSQCSETDCTSVRGWLISIGLPMFIDDFLESNLRSVNELLTLSREDVFNAGVYEDRHITLLLAELAKIQ